MNNQRWNITTTVLLSVLSLTASYEAVAGGDLPRNKPLLMAAYHYARTTDLNNYPRPKTPSLLEQSVFAQFAQARDFFSFESEVIYTDRALLSRDKGSVENWRTLVFARLRASPPLYPGVRENGPPSINELNEENAAERRMQRLITGETLYFVRQNISFINTIVKNLKLEITDRTFKKDPSPPENDQPRSSSYAVKTGPSPAPDNGISFRAGMRLNLEGGGGGVIAEGEAKYQKLNAFYKITLIKNGNSGFGFKYPYGRNVQIAFNHLTTHRDDPINGGKNSERISYNLVMLDYMF